MSREPFKDFRESQKSLIAVVKVKITPFKIIIKIDKNLCHHFNNLCDQRSLVFFKDLILDRAISSADSATTIGWEFV